MTENEAIETLKNDGCYECSGGCDSPVNCSNERCYIKQATKEAIKALEEIQQYRAIGTVDELKEAKEQFDNINLVANSVALCGLCDFGTAKERIISTIKALKKKNVPK